MAGFINADDVICLVMLQVGEPGQIDDIGIAPVVKLACMDKKVAEGFAKDWNDEHNLKLAKYSAGMYIPMEERKYYYVDEVAFVR